MCCQNTVSYLTQHIHKQRKNLSYRCLVNKASWHCFMCSWDLKLHVKDKIGFCPALCDVWWYLKSQCTKNHNGKTRKNASRRVPNTFDHADKWKVLRLSLMEVFFFPSGGLQIMSYESQYSWKYRTSIESVTTNSVFANILGNTLTTEGAF